LGESGGRANKAGNTYEYKWMLLQVLEVLNERIDYVTIEPLGDDENGVDAIIGFEDSIEFQQCKSRCANNVNWSFSAAKKYDFFAKWKLHLDRNPSHKIRLVTQITFLKLQELTERARTTSDNLVDFIEQTNTSDLRPLRENLCAEWGLDIGAEKIEKHDEGRHPSVLLEENEYYEVDRGKFVNLLKRIYVEQTSEESIDRHVNNAIRHLFVGNPKDARDVLWSWIQEGERWSKKIDVTAIRSFIKQRGLQLQDLANDDKIFPAIETLNEQFRSSYYSLEGNIFQREEFAKCQEYIKNGKSIIVHGKAGSGKSGCARYISNYCEDNDIPYVAVRLDHRIPKDNSKAWGISLGLPNSLAHCINAISKNRNAVIILDQLDALRWTASRSPEAVTVCNEIIESVKCFNTIRNHNISVVLVCRTSDLEFDNRIKKLITSDTHKQDNEVWMKVDIGELSNEFVGNFVGDTYAAFPIRLKNLLKTVSNLQIWSKLKSNKKDSNITTTLNLVKAWWNQILEDCVATEFSSNEMSLAKNEFVKLCESRGRTSIRYDLMNNYKNAVEYLISNGFIRNNDDTLSFAHQTILDSFFAEKMESDYFEQKKSVIDTIGLKVNQTPTKRFQVQMLLQNLVESGTSEFLRFGEAMLESDNIRFMIKSLFFEIFTQLPEGDKSAEAFVINYVEKGTYAIQFINNVLFSRPDFVRILMHTGILDKWMKEDAEKANSTARLVSSIGSNYTTSEIAFIRKHATSAEDAKRFEWAFSRGIENDSDDFFELKLELFSQFPNLNMLPFFDLRNTISVCPIKSAKLMSLALKDKFKGRGRRKDYFVEGYLEKLGKNIFLGKGLQVVEILLPLLPIRDEISYDWRQNGNDYNGSLERACVDIIKYAGIEAFTNDPNVFWRVFEKYLGLGSCLHNEIILYMFANVPNLNSDRIIAYLCKDLDKSVFEKTSGGDSFLSSAKNAISIHSQLCNDESYKVLEKTIANYIAPNSKWHLESRIERNKNAVKNGYRIYWSFWGDLQHELLSFLPAERLSQSARELIGVLKRKFADKLTLYRNYKGHVGFVSSPVADKQLSNKQWLNIIFNKKINNNRSKWRSKEVVGGFVDSSLKQFASSFEHAASKEPERMMNLLLSESRQVPEEYITAMLNGVSRSESIKDIPLSLLEAAILKFNSSAARHSKSNVCRIIEERSKEEWSQSVIDVLIDIVLNDRSDSNACWSMTENGVKKDDFSSLEIECLNMPKGSAARAMRSLLWTHKALFEQFRTIIETLANDENPAIKLASLDPLYPSYNFDKEWALELFLSLVKSDIRLAGFHNAGWLFFRIIDLYQDKQQDVFDIFRACFNSDDENLARIGSYWISEAHICFGEFADIIESTDNIGESQAKSMLEMAIIYFDKEGYREKAMEVIRRFFNSSLDLEFPLSRLFFDKIIDLSRDRDFIIELMTSEGGKRIWYHFISYLDEEASKISEYQDFVLDACTNLIENTTKSEDVWLMSKEIITLLAKVYDEHSDKSLVEASPISQKCLDLMDIMYEKGVGSNKEYIRKIIEE